MALSANTVLEIRNVADFAGASDTNGGGFVTGASGTDYSYANVNSDGSAKYSVTDGVTAGTTTITSATAAFGTDVVGNLMYVQGGTGSVAANWYQITARGSSTSITVDRSAGLTAGTGVTLHIGGALATWGLMSSLITVAGQRAWIKYSATAYSMTTATANVSGGIVSLATVQCSIEGYDVTRGDRTGNRPQLTWAAVAAPGGITYMVTGGGKRTRFSNLLLNGNSVNNVGGMSLASAPPISAIQCVVENCNGTAGVGIFGVSGSIGAKACQAIACTTGFSAGMAISCYANSCTTGFLNTSVNVNCLATVNTNGFLMSAANGMLDRCTADSNTTAGFSVSSVYANLINCIASNQSGGGGIGFSIGTMLATMENCFSYNNLTEISGTPLVNEHFTPSASFTGGQPYVTAGSQFAPNATAGAGMLLRGAAIGVAGQTDNTDIGAVQHADPSGGATTYVINQTINHYFVDDREQ